MNHLLIKNLDGSGNVLWVEMVRISIKGIDYTFFRPTPRCKDGHRKEMNKELKIRKGWNCEISRGTHKKVTPYEEILKCLAYKKAYEKVYKRLCFNPLKIIGFKIFEFLDFVDKEATEIKEEYEKEYSGIKSRMEVSVLLTGCFNFKLKHF